MGGPGTDRHHDYSASRFSSAAVPAGIDVDIAVVLGGWVPLPDGVVRAETDPVGDRPVLLHLLAQGHLGAEGLVGRLQGQTTWRTKIVVVLGDCCRRAEQANEVVRGGTTTNEKRSGEREKQRWVSQRIPAAG